jgi:excisionase family DNA binding protein
MKKISELTYDEAAEVLGCSSRHVRRVINRYKIKAIRRGHRTVRLPAEKIAQLKIQLTVA